MNYREETTITNEELKKIREEKNQSKGEFAKLLGVTPMVYGRYEGGTLKIPENIEAAVKEMISKAEEGRRNGCVRSVEGTFGIGGKERTVTTSPVIAAT